MFRVSCACSWRGICVFNVVRDNYRVYSTRASGLDKVSDHTVESRMTAACAQPKECLGGQTCAGIVAVTSRYA